MSQDDSGQTFIRPATATKPPRPRFKTSSRVFASVLASLNWGTKAMASEHHLAGGRIHSSGPTVGNHRRVDRAKRKRLRKISAASRARNRGR